MKKVISLLVMMVAVVTLSACANNVNKPADGEYRRVFDKTKEIADISYLKVKNGILYDGLASDKAKKYTIDSKNLKMVNDDETRDYVYEDGLLYYDGGTFILFGGKKYKEFLSDGYIQE